MKTVRFVVLAMLPALITACTTTRHTAPIVERPIGVKQPDVTRVSTAPLSGIRSNDRGFYTVRKGDTLIQIALDFGQNYRDLVAWNNLANPNDIKVDQVLRVIPPESSAQTGTVATSSGVEVRPLSSVASAAAGVTSNKSTPRGDKRTYSESALAELQKPDANSTSPSAPVTAKTEPIKTVEKAPDVQSGTVSDDDNLSWIWPVDGKIISGFSEGKRGIDIAGKLGQPVVAAGSGKVLYAGSGIRGYGNLVIVKHSSNLLSAYAHNKTIFVKEDQNVSKGQKIAEMGNSDADEIKLHFEIRQQGKPVDPSKFLPSR